MALDFHVRAIAASIVVCFAVAGLPARAQTGALDIASISPSQGPIAGGTILTIAGSGFVPGTVVRFNRTAAANVQVLDASHLQVTAPPLGSGPFATALAAVRVSNASGTAYGEFLYVPPRLDEIRVGDITTIAGVGIFIGEGRLATQALVEAEALAIDASGNLYLGEETGGLVRKIGPDGRIVTIAGNGIVGFSGDGGPATDAQFNWPSGVAVDRAGNIFVADAFGNNRVRKIDATTGIVRTIAGSGRAGFSGDGGPATQALLNTPAGSVALDGQGNTYVLDLGNQRIRKIDGAGIITTVAGTGAVGFSGDGGPATQASFHLTLDQSGAVAVDSHGTLYVVDGGNQRIRRIGSNGIVSTVAGGGSQPISDGVLATDINLIFDCVTVDAQDRLLFSAARRIWRLENNGLLTKLAGTGTAGLSPDGVPAHDAAMVPMNLAVAANGDLFVSERSARRIRRISATTGVLTTAAGIGPATIGDGAGHAVAAVFQDIGNLALDGAGNILVVEPRGSLRIRRIDSAGRIATVAGIGVEPIRDFYQEGMQALSAGMSPVSVQADSVGDIFFTDFCAVRKIGVDGRVRTVVGPLTNNQQCGFGGDGGPGTGALLAAEQDTVKLDAQGNAFVADVFNHRVRRLDAVTGIITTFAGSGPATSPGGYDPNPPSNAFAGDGGPANQALLAGPTDVAFDSRRNVCIADTGNFSVRCVDPQGVIRTVAGRGNNFPGDGGQGTAAILNPYRIAFDRAGNLYISDANNSSIRKLDVNGTISTVAGVSGRQGFSGDGGSALQANLDYGSGLAVDAQGNLLIFDGGNRRIRVVKQADTPASGTASTKTLGSRATVSPSATLYGGFELANAATVYILVRGNSLGALGVTPNFLDAPRVRIYNGQGQDIVVDQSGRPGFDTCLSGTPSASAVVTYYQSVRGQPANGRDACIAQSLAPGAYTFSVTPSVPGVTTSSGTSTPSSGEVLFEVTLGGGGGSIAKTLGSRATVSSTATLYGGFELASAATVYILVRGNSLGTLGVTPNFLDSPRVRVFDGQGRDLIADAGGNPGLILCTSGDAAQQPVFDYYRLVRNQPAGDRDACVSRSLGGGAYTFSVTPSGSSVPASGEVLFEVTISP
jgi:sugar lactone lactonase YvrE